MDNINYEVGLIKAQNEALKDDLEDLTTVVASMGKDVKEMKDQLATWRSSVAGAITVLVVVGNVLLYFGESLVNLIKVKLGL